MARQSGSKHDDEFHEIVESLETGPLVVKTDVHRVVQVERSQAGRTEAQEAPSVTAVIPARNEARNLPYVLLHLPPVVTEVILVDGRSVDSTIRLAEFLLPKVRIIHQTGRGKGDALRCGIAASTGDIVVLMDADGSTDPQEIPLFVAALLEDADYVKGSRYLAAGGSADLTGLRSLGNRFLTGLANLLYGTNFTDFCYGYNAFWRNRADLIPIDCEGFEVEAQLNSRAARAQLRIVEVPSYEQVRKYGASNLHPFRDGLRIAHTILRERFWHAPARAREDLVAVTDKPPDAVPVARPSAPPTTKRERTQRDLA